MPDPTRRSDAEADAASRTMSRVLERNIRTVFQQRIRARKGRTLQDRVSDAVTDFTGSPTFVYLHAAWFATWILLNTGHLGVTQFDPFPYGLLTMVVSLEAIFLATFVMISQNRQADEADARADLVLQMGLLTEHELTRVLQMLDAIQDRLGIYNDADSELADLEVETHPEDVLEEIARVRDRALGRKRPEPGG